MGLHGLLGIGGRRHCKGRTVNHWAPVCLWGYIWDRGEESEFLYEFCSKEKSFFGTFGSFLLNSFWSARKTTHSSPRCFFFQPCLSKCKSLTQSAWGCVPLNSCLSVIVLHTCVLCASILIDSCASQRHFLTQTGSAQMTPSSCGPLTWWAVSWNRKNRKFKVFF